MSRYFNYFPSTIYKNNSDSSSFDVVTNITSKFAFESSFKNNTVIFYEYNIADGDTPEILAHKFYGSSEKHWIILSMNDIVNPMTEWPKNQTSFVRYIDDKYSGEQYANSSVQYAGITWAQTNVHSYYKKETQKITSTNDVTVNSIQLDANTYANVQTSTSNYTLHDGSQVSVVISKETKTYYEYENEENEKKRSIKILKPEFALPVEEELIEVFRNA